MADVKFTAEQMDKAIRQFHSSTAQIDDPNFKAFAGLMRVYLGVYNRAHGGGTSNPMELRTHELEYVTNTMALIFGATEWGSLPQP